MKRVELWLQMSITDKYEVSSYGRVRRLDSGHILGSDAESDNYYMISQGQVLGFNAVHQLVAFVFHGPCPVGMEVNHKDGDKRNNVPWNLEYVTRQGNVNHAIQIGLNPHFSKLPRGPHSEERKQRIRAGKLAFHRKERENRAA